MAVRCSECKREYDITLFEFNRTVTCVCGNIVAFEHKEEQEKISAIRRKEERKNND